MIIKFPNFTGNERMFLAQATSSESLHILTGTKEFPKNIPGKDRREKWFELMGLAGTSQEKPNVLIVDDAPDNLTLLAHLLEGEDYEVRIAPGGRFALQSVSAKLPDLILLDIQMPDVDGFEVCRILKSDESSQNIPIIFLTAFTSTEDEGRGLELGAVDYIIKPFNPQIVRARVRNHMQYIRHRMLLEQMLQLDPLTEVSNRRGFDIALDREWARSLREKTLLSLAMLDVDHFKQFNDKYGHPEGDRVLRLMAEALDSRIRRPGDLVARFGGDEFVVMLPNTDESGAFVIAEQMRLSIRHLNIDTGGLWSSDRLTLSIGGVSMVSDASRCPADLLKNADANLHRAKLAGRDQVVWSMSDDTGFK